MNSPSLTSCLVGLLLAATGCQCAGDTIVCDANGNCRPSSDPRPNPTSPTPTPTTPMTPSGPTRCAADRDCNGGICAAGGTCGDACWKAGCAQTQLCQTNGRCADPCGGELFTTTRVQSNMLIAFDKSGSMLEPINGQPKWTIATAAMKQITQQAQADIRFGLMLFPGATNCSVQPPTVAVGDSRATAIAMALDASLPNGNTPIAGVLTLAANVPELMDPTRSNYVMIVTDGMETCFGNGVAAVQALFQKGIKTYVVGFGAQVDPVNLSAMAVAGGTARAGATAYYQVDDQATLVTALAAITQGAIGCEFALGTAPADVTKVFVFVNGQLVARDPARMDGWDYNAANNHVTLYGSACQKMSIAGAKVTTVYGCPDPTLVESGRPNGSGCTTPGQCASALCVNGVCESPRPPGTMCTTPGQCTTQLCTNGVCEGPRPVGQMCTLSAQCTSGSCVNGVCETPRPAGSPCSAPGQCATQTCTNGICEPGRPNGNLCNLNAQCSSGACVNGLCESPRPTGSPCTQDVQCSTGNCVQGICETGRPNGAACTMNSDCTSQSCTNGTCSPQIN